MEEDCPLARRLDVYQADTAGNAWIATHLVPSEDITRIERDPEYTKWIGPRKESS
jgi:hypothetical protein